MAVRIRPRVSSARDSRDEQGISPLVYLGGGAVLDRQERTDREKRFTPEQVDAAPAPKSPSSEYGS